MGYSPWSHKESDSTLSTKQQQQICIAVDRVNTDSDTRIYLSSVKPDIKEICQNMKQCHICLVFILIYQLS